MDFKQIDIQRLDSSGKYILDEYYVLSYKYFDGWTERNLSADLFIDLYYNCKIDLSFNLRLNKKNNSQYSQQVTTQFELEIPEGIKDLIKTLINQKEIELNYNYADAFLEDSQDEHFVINHKNISHNVSIGILTKKVEFKNECEKLFFQLHNELGKWREEIYKKKLTEI